MSSMLHGCLPDTEYVEVTASAGPTYGIWVTTPPGYAENDDELPIVYVMDGDIAVGPTAPLIVTQVDPFLAVDPCIQVAIGYAGPDAADWAQLRNRDLVPQVSLSPRRRPLPSPTHEPAAPSRSSRPTPTWPPSRTRGQTPSSSSS